MELTVLVVPECPTAAVLRERLAVVLHGRTDVAVTWRTVTDEDQAARFGMRGSPTLLVDGLDPFVRPGETPSLSCRLYGPEHEAVGGTPSVARLREVLTSRSQAASSVAGPLGPGHVPAVPAVVRGNGLVG